MPSSCTARGWWCTPPPGRHEPSAPPPPYRACPLPSDLPLSLRDHSLPFPAVLATPSPRLLRPKRGFAGGASRIALSVLITTECHGLVAKSSPRNVPGPWLG